MNEITYPTQEEYREPILIETKTKDMSSKIDLVAVFNVELDWPTIANALYTTYSLSLDCANEAVDAICQDKTSEDNLIVSRFDQMDSEDRKELLNRLIEKYN
jgi:hypothetical protein